MKKRICSLTILFSLILTTCLLLPVTADAKEPEIIASLRSYIQVYGTLYNSSNFGTTRYTSSISYQKKNKRLCFLCTMNNGSSVCTMKMYMPISRKKASYTANYKQTIRAKGRTAVITGKAAVKRKTYSNQSTNLKFSRNNKTKWSKYIKNRPYQIAANSHLKIAFWMWENSLEKQVTICFPNFGFRNVTVYDKSIRTYEW